MAAPTIDVLTGLLRRAEDLQKQCGRGLLRTAELQEALRDLDVRTAATLKPLDETLFRVSDRRARAHTDFYKVTPSGYVDASDGDNAAYRAETLRQVIEEYSPGYLDGPALTSKDQHFFGAADGYAAMRLVLDILKGAKKSAAILDEYLDDTVFDYIDALDPAIQLQLITGNKKPIFPRLLHALQGTRPGVEGREASDCHDRFLIVDAVDAWHMGASLNGFGKKAFMINKVTDPTELQIFMANLGAWWGNLARKGAKTI